MSGPLAVPGTYNLRDVGGYPAAGGTVRRGRLLRSDGLGSLGEDGRAALAELDVGTVVDLRDDFEAEAMPDDLGDLPVTVVRLPVFEGSGASQGMRGARLEDLYSAIVTLHADVLARALTLIAEADERPVLVHCTAGKDRTGVVVALALLAVGVGTEVVVADYAASEENLDGEWLERMLALVTGHGIPETAELRVLLGGSPPEALAATLRGIERAHGSVRGFLLAAGLDELVLARLRERLVEPA